MYVIQAIINGELCTVSALDENGSYNATLAMYQELAAAEPYGDPGRIDAILRSHGCNERGRGFIRNEFEGFPIVDRGDGTAFTRINGVDHDIINPDYVPTLETSLLTGGGWTSM